MINNTAQREPASEFETEMDDASFRALASIVKSTSGIVMADNKKSMLVSRLTKRLKELGIPDFASYCRHVESAQGTEERRNLIFLLTTNVTRFFREEHHFQALKQDILPGLLNRARQGGRVRIWSAGCSSGEEPYSIAMSVLESYPQAGELDLRILATDLDASMILHAREGRYLSPKDGHVPDHLKKRFLLPVPGNTEMIEVLEAARQLVTFAELNLMEDWPMQGKFDLIFCRNVVIYFDAETQNKLWSRFSGMLAPGGYLFIGHSERISTSSFKELVPAGITQYRRD